MPHVQLTQCFPSLEVGIVGNNVYGRVLPLRTSLSSLKFSMMDLLVSCLRDIINFDSGEGLNIRESNGPVRIRESSGPVRDRLDLSGLMVRSSRVR